MLRDTIAYYINIYEGLSSSSQVKIGCSGLVHWDDPGGWDGERGGRGILDGEHMCAHGWFTLMYGKNHYNIVK